MARTEGCVRLPASSPGQTLAGLLVNGGPAGASLAPQVAAGLAGGLRMTRVFSLTNSSATWLCVD